MAQDRPSAQSSEPRLPRFTGWLRPLVDVAARIRASVHVKLLSGFLVGALLLVALAVLSLVVIGRMNERVQDIDRLQVATSRAQQMLYAVTAQSHYRAMALLTQDPKYNASIAEAKSTFAGLLDAMARDDPTDAQILPGPADGERHLHRREQPGPRAVRRPATWPAPPSSISTRSIRSRTCSRRRSIP